MRHLWLDLLDVESLPITLGRYSIQFGHENLLEFLMQDPGRFNPGLFALDFWPQAPDPFGLSFDDEEENEAGELGVMGLWERQQHLQQHQEQLDISSGSAIGGYDSEFNSDTGHHERSRAQYQQPPRHLKKQQPIAASFESESGNGNSSGSGINGDVGACDGYRLESGTVAATIGLEGLEDSVWEVNFDTNPDEDNHGSEDDSDHHDIEDDDDDEDADDDDDDEGEIVYHTIESLSTLVADPTLLLMPTNEFQQTENGGGLEAEGLAHVEGVDEADGDGRGINDDEIMETVSEENDVQNQQYVSVNIHQDQPNGHQVLSSVSPSYQSASSAAYHDSSQTSPSDQQRTRLSASHRYNNTHPQNPQNHNPKPHQPPQRRKRPPREDRIQFPRITRRHDWNDVITEGALSGNLRVVQLLNKPHVVSSSLAMDQAAGAGYLEIIQYLYTHRWNGCTTLAMDLASRGGHLDVVQWLHFNTKEGCSVDALDSAAESGKVDVVKFLMEWRNEGGSPELLWKGVKGGAVGVVRYLMEGDVANLMMTTRMCQQQSGSGGGSGGKYRYMNGYGYESLSCAGGSSLSFEGDHWSLRGKLGSKWEKVWEGEKARIENIVRRGEKDIDLWQLMIFSAVFGGEDLNKDVGSQEQHQQHQQQRSDENKSTPIYWKVQLRKRMMQNLLLMDVAALFGNVEMLEYLNKWGTEPTNSKKRLDMDKGGMLVVDSVGGEDGNGTDNSSKPPFKLDLLSDKAYALAALQGHIKVLEWLYANRGGINFNAKDNHGNNKLGAESTEGPSGAFWSDTKRVGIVKRMAMRNGKVDVVRWFEEKGF
jgi:hypothetical protein